MPSSFFTNFPASLHRTLFYWILSTLYGSDIPYWPTPKYCTTRFQWRILKLDFFAFPDSREECCSTIKGHSERYRPFNIVKRGEHLFEWSLISVFIQELQNNEKRLSYFLKYHEKCKENYSLKSNFRYVFCLNNLYENENKKIVAYHMVQQIF